MQIKIFFLSGILLISGFFLPSCSQENNLVMKQTDGNFLVIAYGKTRKDAELSANSTSVRKCASLTPVLKSITTDYIGAISEKENQIAGKVLDMLNQVTSKNSGFNIPTDSEQDLESYKTQIIFSCD